MHLVRNKAKRMKIVIGARKSQLSRKQVDEVVQELLKHSSPKEIDTEIQNFL